MIRHLLNILMFVSVALCFIQGACNNDNSNSANLSVGGSAGVVYKIASDTMPPSVDSAKVAFRDLNYWIENDMFCVASLVDNKTPLWQRIWVRLEVLDGDGNPLKIAGQPDLILRAKADNIPPLGASAVFAVIPVSQISGTPKSCRLSGAGAVQQSLGPILLATEIRGVRMLLPDPQDSTRVVEKAFACTASIDNPLDQTAYHPRLVLLLYGKDEKLYFVQTLNPEDKNPLAKIEPAGPIGPQQKRPMMCPIGYDQLPKKLQEVLIGHVDIQVYESMY